MQKLKRKESELFPNCFFLMPLFFLGGGSLILYQASVLEFFTCDIM